MARKATPSVIPELKKNSPLLLECQKPQIKFIKNQNYGVKKLYYRLNYSK